MAWQDEAVPMLRVLINDFGAEPTYSDSRLTDILVAAAFIVNQEVQFAIDYEVTMSAKTISPDPTTEDDDYYLSMIVLKGACIADQSTYRTKALLEGVRAALGPATLAIAGNLNGFAKILEIGACKTYEQLRDNASFGTNALNVRAILSPFVGNKFDPSILRINEAAGDRRSDWSY